jgi:hypothetical protein
VHHMEAGEAHGRPSAYRRWLLTKRLLSISNSHVSTCFWLFLLPWGPRSSYSAESRRRRAGQIKMSAIGSSAKPDERFLIYVVLAILFILGISLAFLVRSYILTAIRRLRNQRTTSQVTIPKKKRPRRPRLFEVWVDWTAADDGRRLPKAESRYWEELQVSIILSYYQNQ